MVLESLRDYFGLVLGLASSTFAIFSFSEIEKWDQKYAMVKLWITESLTRKKLRVKIRSMDFLKSGLWIVYHMLWILFIIPGYYLWRKTLTFSLFLAPEVECCLNNVRKQFRGDRAVFLYNQVTHNHENHLYHTTHLKLFKEIKSGSFCFRASR